MSNDAAVNEDVRHRVALATLQGKYVAHEVAVDVDVSPCSWMYPGYGFQIGYRAGDGSCWGVVKDDALTVATATRADVQRMLDTLTKSSCSQCASACLRDADTVKYRGTLCEKCWMADFDARNKQHMEKERRALERRDARMVRKGYTHRISAWVHPARGGDDYLVDLYTKAPPTKEEIARFLKKEGSRVFDDYGVVALVK